MTQTIEFLLGIDRINLSEGGTIRFEFLASWPAWVAFLAVVAGVAYVWNIYRRESPGTPPFARGFLVVLRCLVVFLALFLLFEPALVLERNDVIPSSVAVMLDRSESMTVRDGARTGDDEGMALEALRRAKVVPAAAGEPTRFELARAALGLDEAAALKAIAADQRIYLYAFDDAPQLLSRIDGVAGVDEAIKSLAAVELEGTRTAAPRSLEMMLEQLAGQTLTAVVLLTDGRSTVRAGTDKLKEMAEARDIPFLAVGLGSTKPPNDAEILSLDAKRWAFISEEPVVRVTLSNQGYEGQKAELELTVKDHPELNVTEEVTLGGPGAPQPVDLRIKPEVAGTYEVSVALKSLPGEFDEANNSALPFEIDVLERKPRVLLVEDLPRWEYQYLKNALYRDKTVQVSVLLMSADLQFAPEGDIPVRGFPTTRKELFEYDVIIIGDVDRRMFSREQLEWVEEFVREKGGGVIFIAGGRLLNPNTYVDTPLETLLPIVVSDEQLAGNVSNEWHPEITIEGAVSPVLAFEKVPDQNRQAWQNLEPFYWYYQARNAKAGAQVLLQHSEDQGPYGKFPIMVMQSVGAGKVFFSATDETWRWRYYTGRRYFNTFWLQLVRYMALPQDEATISAGRQRYSLGDTAKIALRVADRRSLPESLEEVKATVACVPAEGGEPRTQEVVLQQTKARSGVFEAEFTPERVGEYALNSELSIKRGRDAVETITAESEFVVAPSREEFEVPTRDDAFLAAVAGFSPDSQNLSVLDMATLHERIVNRSRTVSNDLTDEIWDCPASLILFILLIGTEWVFRKKYRML